MGDVLFAEVAQYQSAIAQISLSKNYSKIDFLLKSKDRYFSCREISVGAV
jgi:hypothetical protein